MPEPTLQDFFTDLERAIAAVKQAEATAETVRRTTRADISASLARRKGIAEAAAATLKQAQAEHDRLVGEADQAHQGVALEADRLLKAAQAASRAAHEAAQPILAELQTRTAGLMATRA